MNVKPEPFDIDPTTSRRAARQPRPSAVLPLLLPFLLLCGASRLEPAQIVTPDLTTASTDTLTDTPRQASYVMIAPAAEGKLFRKSVPAPGVFLTRENVAYHRGELQEKLVTGALRQLLRDYAGFFNPGSALLGPVSLRGGWVDVNLNSAYAADNAGWTPAEVQNRVMSIVHTAVATKEPVSGSESSEVRFFIEGKPVQKLGALDVSRPIEGAL